MIEFEKRYKIIIKCEFDEYFTEKINWINTNSTDLVGIIKIENEYYFGFKNEDDALIFKIRYKI